ncbi:MAG: iron chaperone [Thermoplasmatota archaeon]
MPRRPPADVRAYLAKTPPLQRGALERLRAQILAAAPEAEEKVSYGIPGFFHHGRLVWVAAFRDHCSFFAMYTGAGIAKRSGLSGFTVSKGTIRFAPDHPLPARLVRKIVRARVAENEARASKGTPRAPRKARPAPRKPEGRGPRKARARRVRRRPAPR